MPDQIIDPAMALAVHADAMRTHPLMGWVVMRDEADYPGKAVARLATDTATVYVLVADTLAELHAMLPPGLKRTKRQPDDPPDVVEVWFPE